MSAKQSFDEKNTHMEGVYPASKKDGTPYFRASFTYRRKHISLGSFSTEKKANAAYREALRIAEKESVKLDSYRESSPLSYEKWVSIINFRDNNIYFGHPIYIKQRYFEYHFSPALVLKFDHEDLFYYSSHKIMKRGGHYFVADYGMQVNIFSRYGIKNYAVAGEDYKFINDDPTDFRRENLEIWNKYQGVKLVNKNGFYSYVTKIHVNGNVIVGKYKTENEAAIAYNKAIDILLAKGLNKNYSENYVDISPREYAEIYTSIEVSDKIKNMII